MAAAMPDMPAFANLRDLMPLAKERIEEGAWGYIAGGAEDETTLTANEEAFARWRFLPRVLRDVSKTTTGTRVLGTEISMPVLVAPTAYHQLVHPEGEVATAQGSADAGTLYTMSTLSNRLVEDVAVGSDGPKWMQVYVFRDRKLTEDLVSRAEKAGFEALVLTVDLPVSGRRERDFRTGFRMPKGLGLGNFPKRPGEATAPHDIVTQQIDPTLEWKDVAWLQDMTDLPVIVKGVLDPADAEDAVDAGVAGIVVSNHGGRQLDHAVASLDALPHVVAAVEDRVDVLMDGGVRRGTDVLKAIALGARAVLVGRPVLWGLAVGGRAGVAAVLDHLRSEVLVSMQILGARSVEDVTPDRLLPVV